MGVRVDGDELELELELELDQAKLDTLGKHATLTPGTDAQLATPLESECVTSQVGFGHRPPKSACLSRRAEYPQHPQVRSSQSHGRHARIREQTPAE